MEGSEEIVLGTGSRSVYHLINWEIVNSWIIPFYPELIWQDLDTRSTRIVYLDNPVDKRAIVTVELGKNFNSELRVYLKEILDDLYADLLVYECEGIEKNELTENCPELKTDSGIRLRSGALQDVYLDKLFGSKCLIVLAHLTPLGQVILFLNPYTLRPVRTPIVTARTIVNCKIVQYQYSWMLVATLIYDEGSNFRIGIWDLSQMASRQCPPPLGFWHEGGFDSSFLQVIESPSSWEAYYIIDYPIKVNQPISHEVWKFKWPDATCQRIIKLPPGYSNGLSVISI